MSSNSIQDAFLRWDPQVTSPFTSLSRRVYPRTVREVFAWAEELWMHHGLYSQAIRKAVRYFMTEIEVKGDTLDHESRKKYTDSLEDLGILNMAATVGDDFIAFGNSFTSIYHPFTRILVCNNCGFQAPLKHMKPYYTWQNGLFKGQCYGCKSNTTYNHRDVPKPFENSRPSIIRWPPQFMEINHNPISTRSEYKLDLDRYDELRQGIMNGDLLYLEDTPWEIIQAVINNQKFTFKEGSIFHMMYPPISCCIPALKGWGMPPFMAEFETALMIHMLDKYTEAILIDYLIPFRVISPPKGNGEVQGDPMLNINMGNFTGRVKTMLDRHRQNPTDWNFLPFPLDYQVLGGEAKDIVPVDVQEHFEQRLLNSMGIPTEFYKGSFTETGSLIGFKMFERNWQHFGSQLNEWLSWVTERHGEMLKWEKAEASLIPVSLYEDPEIRDIKLQLAAGNEISKQTAYRPLGIDVEIEREKVFDEEDAYNEAMMKRQEDQATRDANTMVAKQPGPGEQIMAEEEAAAAQAEGGAPGGAPGGAMGGAPPMGQSLAPGGGGGGMSGTMDDLLLQADQIAQQLITADPLTRKRTLSDLKSSNEALHAQVKQRLTNLEQMSAQQGVQLVRSGQAPPPQ